MGRFAQRAPEPRQPICAPSSAGPAHLACGPPRPAPPLLAERAAPRAPASAVCHIDDTRQSLPAGRERRAPDLNHGTPRRHRHRCRRSLQTVQLAPIVCAPGRAGQGRASHSAGGAANGRPSPPASSQHFGPVRATSWRSRDNKSLNDRASHFIAGTRQSSADDGGLTERTVRRATSRLAKFNVNSFALIVSRAAPNSP